MPKQSAFPDDRFWRKADIRRNGEVSQATLLNRNARLGRHLGIVQDGFPVFGRHFGIRGGAAALRSAAADNFSICLGVGMCQLAGRSVMMQVWKLEMSWIWTLFADRRSRQKKGFQDLGFDA
jgi:hypothetical protein